MSDRVETILTSVLASVDRKALEGRIGPLLDESAPVSSATAPVATSVLHKIVLSDILDDAILGARPGEPSYPIRLLFGELGDSLDDETAEGVSFAFANGINFYFRVSMEEETKTRVALEVSRLYYEFADARGLDRDLVGEISPLLARLLSTELEHVALESVDAARVFDSTLHERAPGSDPTGSKIDQPKSFLARVVSNRRVRAKARVRTC